ncbi:MAG: hypothetical protein M3008_11285 [Chloroflexota bacterium]|nr:hypothetical protein [Chloroflexota bacterium]
MTAIPSTHDRQTSPDEQTSAATRIGVQRATLWALIGSLALAVVYGRVAVTNLTYGVIGGYSNGYEDVWNDYWLRTALHLHRNPFYTNYLFAPNGVSLRFHTLNPFGGLIALPLSPLIGIVGAMNLKFLLALVGSLFFAFLLMRDLTGSPLAAFAGAAVYTYANDQMISYFSTGAENYLMGTALLPLYLFFLFRALAQPRWWGYAAAATVTLLALCLTDWQYTMFAVLVTVLYLLFTLCTRQSWREKALIVGKAALIGSIWSVAVFLPLVLPMIRESRASPWLNVSGEAITLSRSLVQSFQIGLGNPGYLVLILTGAGLLLLWRRAAARPDRLAVAFWAIVALLASLLALGPSLKLTENRVIDLPLPYDPLTRLPVFTAGRRPQLFYFIAMLAFGVLCAFALRELFVWLRAVIVRRERSAVFNRLSRAAPVALVAAILTATLAPFAVRTGDAKAFPLTTPPFYRDVLAKDSGQYAILELPLFSTARGADWPAYQIVHGKQIFDGSLSRDHKLESPNIFVTQATFFRDFFRVGQADAQERYRPTKTPDILAPPDYTTVSTPLLNYYHVRYIILYPDALRATAPNALADARRLVGQALGARAQPVYMDTITEVYRVPDAPPPANPVFMDMGDRGWFPAARTPTQEPYRWADSASGDPATFLLFNLSPVRQRVTVRMTVQNYAQPRAVDLSINGFALDHFTLTDRATRGVAVEFDVPPGMSKLTLASPEPPVPVREPGARDNRLLSFSVRGVQIATT